MDKKNCHSERSEESHFCTKERSFANAQDDKPDFSNLKKRANGMMPAEVYKAIYETAQSIPSGGTIVEVGTAHGAGTIAAALGAANADVHTIDKIRGGSRDAFGSFEQNIKIIRDNFTAFGVSDRITFHAGTSLEIASDLAADMKIGLLMLDADGAIDRDFKLFYDRLLPGAAIIIDDYQPNFVRFYNEGRQIKADQKRRLTALLVDYYATKGYLKFTRRVDNTWFGTKPQNAPSITSVNADDIFDIYRGLTFASGASHSRTAEWVNTVTQKFPGLHKALKKIYMSGK